jgi:photosystem II stability/assembly factor-like uncharacterized protein
MMKLQTTRVLFPAALLCVATLYTTECAVAGWQVQNSGTMVHLYSITAAHGSIDVAWACGEGGTILYTSNGGLTWTPQNSTTTNTLYSIVFLEVIGNPVIAAGEGGTILRTTDLGTTWLSIPSGTTQTLRGISDFAASAGGHTIVGDSGIILRTTNNGLSWQRVSSPTTARLNAVAASFAGSICGENGIILRRNAVTAWEIVNSGTTANLYGIPMFSAADLVVGEGGMVLRSTSGGVSWFPQNTPTTFTLRATQYSVNNTSRIYAVGDNGTILKTTNGGQVWGLQESGTLRNLHSVFFYLDDNRGYACGDSGMILRTNDGGGPIITGVDIGHRTTPTTARLEQNYPNPFNPLTVIHYQLPNIGGRNAIPTYWVTLKVYNLLGQEVATLVDELKEAGTYAVSWEADGISSGVYVYTLRAGTFRVTKKMILVQ